MKNVSHLKTAILEQFKGALFRFTPSDLVRRLKRNHPEYPSARIRDAVKALVRQGILVYSHRLSATQIEVNYGTRVPIAPCLTLLIGGTGPEPLESGVVIRLAGGEAFGMGDHPTTRLVLKSLCRAGAWLSKVGAPPGCEALDIGTGTGVLALAAARLGFAPVTALDNDPLALHEARSNVALNRLTDAIAVSDTPLAQLPAGRFTLVLANLRPPTLHGMVPQMARVSRAPAVWIVSGFRPDESDSLAGKLEKRGANLVWRQIENGWGAFAAAFYQEALKGLLVDLEKPR